MQKSMERYKTIKEGFLFLFLFFSPHTIGGEGSGR